MRFILKVSAIFILSLILVFTLVACGGKDNEQGGNDNNDNASLNENNSSVITGATDNNGGIDINDIFGGGSDSQSGSSSDTSSGSSNDSSQNPSGSVGGSDSSLDSSNNSSGINYDDPSIWTDPV